MARTQGEHEEQAEHGPFDVVLADDADRASVWHSIHGHGTVSRHHTMCRRDKQSMPARPCRGLTNGITLCIACSDTPEPITEVGSTGDQSEARDPFARYYTSQSH